MSSRTTTRRRTLARRTAWAGVVCAFALAIIWIASAWWSAVVVTPLGVRALVGRGIAQFVEDDASTGWRVEWSKTMTVGIEFWHRRNPWAQSTWNPRVRFHVPIWTMILATAVPSAWVLFATRRFGAGQCTKCGYDLSGLNAEPRVCPECGRAA